MSKLLAATATLKATLFAAVDQTVPRDPNVVSPSLTAAADFESTQPSLG
jgi:hypothetical protein